MSVFNQPLQGAAPPATSINPSGIAPGMAVNTLMQVRQGQLNRSAAAARQRMAQSHAAAENAKQREFQERERKKDRDYNRESEERAREREDQRMRDDKFYRNQSELISRAIQQANDESRELSNQIRIAHANGDQQTVNELRKRRQEVEKRKAEYGQKFSTVSVLRKTFENRFSEDNAKEFFRSISESGKGYTALGKQFSDAIQTALQGDEADVQLDSKDEVRTPKTPVAGGYVATPGGLAPIVSRTGSTGGRVIQEASIGVYEKLSSSAAKILSRGKEEVDEAAVQEHMDTLLRSLGAAGSAGTSEEQEAAMSAASEAYQQLVANGVDNRAIDIFLTKLDTLTEGTGDAASVGTAVGDQETGEVADPIDTPNRDVIANIGDMARDLTDAEGELLTRFYGEGATQEDQLQEGIFQAFSILLGAKNLGELHEMLSQDPEDGGRNLIEILREAEENGDYTRSEALEGIHTDMLREIRKELGRKLQGMMDDTQEDRMLFDEDETLFAPGSAAAYKQKIQGLDAELEAIADEQQDRLTDSRLRYATFENDQNVSLRQARDAAVAALQNATTQEELVEAMKFLAKIDAEEVPL